ncbi:MAG: cystathionine beta-lyase [Candidatus Tokpelaia sp. JSC161]|jgi:cystathionine beta-lyase|nr:MAG: cystathionine beta-lyase [Candidatus Tokpelaia sp. JSC161]
MCREKMNNKDFGINTRLVHQGYDPFDNYGFINPPVFRGSTVLFPDAETMENKNQVYIYGIHGTPTTDVLCRMMSSLEGSAKTLLLPSGLSGITVALCSLLKAGDHLLMVDTVYSPTRRFSEKMLINFGIEVEYYRAEIGKEIERLFRPNTKVIFLESPGSNTFEIQDIPGIVSSARKIGAITMMDNTWATPLYFRPLEHGVDISIHAATKYLSGHSDILFGMISVNDKYASFLDEMYGCFGMTVSSDDAYLVLRGLRTMGLRLKHQQETALALARWLETCPEIERVLYPALESNPGYSVWKRDFTGASGVFSIVFKRKSKTTTYKFLNNLQLFRLGYSWGGVLSLALYVDLSDRLFPPVSYSGSVVRFQIGIEDFDDLKSDISCALEAIK